MTRPRSVSAKRAAAHPELLKSGSTIARKPAKKKSAARKPVKKKNAKRAAKNHERAYGDKLAFIGRCSCHFCGYAGATEAAHTKTGGAGRKSGSENLVPMCGMHMRFVRYGLAEGCHARSHRIGIVSFLKEHGLTRGDLDDIAARYEAEYRAMVGDGERLRESCSPVFVEAPAALASPTERADND